MSGGMKELDVNGKVIYVSNIDESDERPVHVQNVDIPWGVIQNTFGARTTKIFKKDLGEVAEYYKIYKSGKSFNPDRPGEKAVIKYANAKLNYKKVATLIDKQARFLFGESPDIDVEFDGNKVVETVEDRQRISDYQRLLNRVFQQNLLDKQLMQAAKDAFVGKRVAAVVNFNLQDGITIEFINAFRFIYTTKQSNANELETFAAYTVVYEDDSEDDTVVYNEDKYKYVWEKLYESLDIYDENGVYLRTEIYLSERLFDFDGNEVEHEDAFTDRLIEDMTSIPVAVITNDGLLEEQLGVSDVDKLQGYEELYSKLSNADIDSLRLGMNPIKYTIDMTNKSTKELPIGPSAYWELVGNWSQNEGKATPQVGIIEHSNSYSTALDTTLERISSSMYDELDIPNVTLSTLQGTITSGKALKAIYWGLIVRCKEKMKVWGPNIEKIAKIIIEGSKAFPEVAQSYITSNIEASNVEYRIEVESNYPLPEDDAEEQELDMAKVTNEVMSRKTYIKRWQKLTDAEADEEIKQIMLERAALELATQSVNAILETGYPSDSTEYEYGPYKYYNPTGGKKPVDPDTVSVTEGE